MLAHLSQSTVRNKCSSLLMRQSYSYNREGGGKEGISAAPVALWHVIVLLVNTVVTVMVAEKPCGCQGYVMWMWIQLHFRLGWSEVEQKATLRTHNPQDSMRSTSSNN